MAIGDSIDDRDAPRVTLWAPLRNVVVAFAEVALTDEANGEPIAPAPEKPQRIADQFERWSGSGSGSVGLGLRLLLVVIELLPLFVIGRWSRMTRLSLRERIHYLEALEGHRVALIATAFVGLKIPIVMLAFEDGPELAASGFDRPDVKARRRLPVR